MDSPTNYAIRVTGHLERDRSDWLAGLEVTNLEHSETLLLGTLPGQGRRVRGARQDARPRFDLDRGEPGAAAPGGMQRALMRDGYQYVDIIVFPELGAGPPASGQTARGPRIVCVLPRHRRSRRLPGGRCECGPGKLEAACVLTGAARS